MTSLRNKSSLFLRQTLDTISDYDLVEVHSNAWRELDILTECSRKRLLAEIECRELTPFSKELVQRLFMSGITDHHLRMIKISGAFSLISLLLFIFVDAMIVPDVLWLAVSFKVFLISPVSLYCVLRAENRQESNIDLMAMIGYVLTEVMLVGIMAMSSSPHAWIYGFAIALVCANANLVQSLPARNAVLLTIISLCLSSLGFGICKVVTIPVLLFATSCIWLFCLFSLFANYRLEVVYRRQYVNGLLQKLNADNLVKINRTLNQHAWLDSLTGIGNRRLLDEKMAILHSDYAKTRQHLCLLMIDVDHFKKINDRHGHLVGDEVLRRVASLLAAHMQSRAGLVARFGGEEFVILVPGITLNEGVNVAEELRQKVENTVIMAEGSLEPIRLTISIGCHVAVPNRDEKVDDFIAEADGAVYAAKQQGRNRVCVSKALALAPVAKAS